MVIVQLSLIEYSQSQYQFQSRRVQASLRRMKTYLRSTMSQERLNHVTILHSHQNMCQEFDLNDIADVFIHRTTVRRNTFQAV